MILKDFVMLLTEQPRSRAYIQKFIENNIFPSYVIYLSDSKENVEYKVSKREKAFFNINKSVYESLVENNVDFIKIDNTDCNSNVVINEVKSRKEKYIIFSASGILRKDILDLDKKFIHIHPGIIPEYRGSTCFYYSIINNGNIGATAFFMNEGIDQGEIIRNKEYEVPLGVDIDNIFDPYIRAELLFEVIEAYIHNGTINSKVQHSNEGETYHVIHPILKNLAITKANNMKKIGQVYWFIGLSGAGKSTLAKLLYDDIRRIRDNVKFIDGDELRSALGGMFGYSIEDRKKSASVVTFLAKSLSECGIDVVIANQGAFEDLRNKARRELINYNEIYVKCSMEECINRDVKGYYKKALSGELKNFLGIDQKFEEPSNPDLIIETDVNKIDESHSKLKRYIMEINDERL